MKQSAVTIVRTVAELRARVAEWRAQGLRVAFAPTMGALHDGHLSLVRRGLEVADRVVVSIFVNPTQFGPNEDLSKYPRREAQDAQLLEGAGAHLLFAPTVEEMYPEGFATSITVTGVSGGLCGDIRPGHFSGVATVVTKLLLMVLPDIAIFGEKDYQQLQVIKRMVRDLNIPVAVEGAPTVREADGLALSSRNAYLSDKERREATAIYRTLTAIAQRLRDGEEAEPLLAWGAKQLLAEGFLSVDYIELRDADSLVPLTGKLAGRSGRLLAAARLSGARLIDNIAV